MLTLLGGTTGQATWWQMLIPVCILGNTGLNSKNPMCSVYYQWILASKKYFHFLISTLAQFFLVSFFICDNFMVLSTPQKKI